MYALARAIGLTEDDVHDAWITAHVCNSSWLRALLEISWKRQ